VAAIAISQKPQHHKEHTTQGQRALIIRLCPLLGGIAVGNHRASLENKNIDEIMSDGSILNYLM